MMWQLTVLLGVFGLLARAQLGSSETNDSKSKSSPPFLDIKLIESYIPDLIPAQYPVRPATSCLPVDRV
jgi:hypothetical protein